MSQLDEILAIDAAAFTGPDQMPGGEAVTYKPSGGGSRPINAQVERVPTEEIVIGNQVRMPKMIIEVANNATTGIALSEIDWGGDTVTLAYQKGGTAADHPIVGEVLSQDAGMIRLALG